MTFALQNAMAGAGPAAERIAKLGSLVLVTFSVAAAVMWILVFALARRRRGSLDTHLPWNAPEDRGWLMVGGLAIPALAFVTIFVLMLRTMSAFPMGQGAEDGRAEIRITGHQWWWQIEYLDQNPQGRVLTANELHVPVGRAVDIELTSVDVIHSFWIPQIHGKVDLIPGRLTRLRVQADRAGLFRGQCSEYCGPQHAHMIIVLVAQPQEEYADWIDGLRAPAAEPASPIAQAGQQVFLRSQCALCHTVRGSPAQGRIGPDLTHFAGRTGIAANTLPNMTAPLAAWVTHAQSIKPYAQMPNVTSFTGDELQALLAYLQGLK